MILGGPARGDSNRARKLHLRELNKLHHEIKELEGMDTRPVLVLGPGDETCIQQPHNDALVITAMVANCDIARILVDTGSSADVIYLDCFRQLNLSLEVRPVDPCLVRFFGETLQAWGEVTMPISLGCHPARMTKGIDFLILDSLPVIT